MKLSHHCDFIERNIEHVNVWMMGMMQEKRFSFITTKYKVIKIKKYKIVKINKQEL